MTFDSALFRRVMGQFATGVTLVTTRIGDDPWAMTANSFTSISLSPPIVMVAVSQGLTSNTSIRENQAFTVNVLAADQENLSRRFALRDRPPDQFTDLTLRSGITGSPIIEGCIAWIECKLRDFTEQGDHTVFFGEVVDMSLDDPREPLLYYNSGYARLAPSSLLDSQRRQPWQERLVSSDTGAEE